MSAESINPPDLATPRGYSHGTLAPPGHQILALAGQIGWDAAGRLADGFVAQFALALDNLLAVLKAAGGVPEHLLSLRIYVVDKRVYREAAREVGQLYRELPWRPAHLHYLPAIERFREQIASGLHELERRLTGDWYVDDRMTQADIKAAIVLTFVRYYARPLGIALASHPRLEALTARLEATAAFIAAPLDQ